MPNPSQKLFRLHELEAALFNMMMEERAYGKEKSTFSMHLAIAMSNVKVAQEILIEESFASGAMAWFDTSDEGLINGNPDSDALA